jgi:hypothetical protein
MTACDAGICVTAPVRGSVASTIAGSRFAATARSTTNRTSSVCWASHVFCTPPTRRRTGSAIVSDVARFASSGSASHVFARPVPEAMFVSTDRFAAASSNAPVETVCGFHVTDVVVHLDAAGRRHVRAAAAATNSSTSSWPPWTVTSQTMYRASAVRSIRFDRTVS